MCIYNAYIIYMYVYAISVDARILDVYIRMYDASNKKREGEGMFATQEWEFSMTCRDSDDRYLVTCSCRKLESSTLRMLIAYIIECNFPRGNISFVFGRKSSDLSGFVRIFVVCICV